MLMARLKYREKGKLFFYISWVFWGFFFHNFVSSSDFEANLHFCLFLHRFHSHSERSLVTLTVRQRTPGWRHAVGVCRSLLSCAVREADTCCWTQPPWQSQSIEGRESIFSASSTHVCACVLSRVSMCLYVCASVIAIVFRCARLRVLLKTNK